jgi:Flp pilus assembly protein TadG
MLRGIARRFGRDQHAGVAIIFALSIIPIIFLIGMGLDFSVAAQKRLRLNAAADAAALAAVNATAMTESVSSAQSEAQGVFMAQASLVPELRYSAPTIQIQQTGSGRTAVVSYVAYSQNAFPNVLGLLTGTSEESWTISGSSTATSGNAPNIDFYLLLDNSPSMDIAATTNGINTMVANTPAQGGCAFACHESNPAADNLGNPGGEDNYTLAKNLGVVTRIENMATATAALTATAQSTEQADAATYRMAIDTFSDSGINAIQNLTGNLTQAQNAAARIDVQEVCSNNWLTCSNDNNDTDTNFESAMQQVNALIPDPGSGVSGQSPQEVLFLVTDGVDDENAATCSQAPDGTRCQQPFDTRWCTTIKSRGIRIAVVYTEYLPLPTNAWYSEWIAPFQNQIGPNMQSCASPGLFFEVTTDGDITTALQSLFQQSVSEARLSQ